VSATLSYLTAETSDDSAIVGLGASIVGRERRENTMSTARRRVQSVVAAGVENHIQTATAY